MLGNGVPSTIYNDVDPEIYLGPRGKECYMVNSQGLRLKTYFWPAEKPKATIVFVHGHGAHLQFEVLRSEKLGDAQV